MKELELFRAIAEHDIAGVGRALDAGSDPDAVQSDWPYWRPLHLAIEEIDDGGPLDTVILLLRRGADVDGRDGQRDATPLLMACLRQQWETVRVLLAGGARVDVVGLEGDTPLSATVEAGPLDSVRLLLRCGAGATLNRATGIDGITPLGAAARRLDVELIDVLLQAGAEPDRADLDRRLAVQRMPARTPDNSALWDRVRSALS